MGARKASPTFSEKAAKVGAGTHALFSGVGGTALLIH